MSKAQSQQPFDPDTQALLEIGRSLGTTCNLDDLLQMVIEYSMRLLKADRATLFLYDRNTEELVSRIAEGTGELRIPANTGIAGTAAQSLTSVNVPDAYDDPRFNRSVDAQTGYRTRNILACPLTDYDGQLVGVLQVLNKKDGSFNDHDIALAEAFSAQAGVAFQRSRLLEAFLEKRRLEEALRLAQEIQQRLLPREAPAVGGFDIACWNRPCDATGGDYCDFLRLDDHRVALSFGDVSGHGVGPALVSCATRAMLRALASRHEAVNAVMDRVNNLMSQDLAENRFVTAFLGILDAQTAQMQYSSAGQGPLLWIDGQSGECEVRGAQGVPVGILADFCYPHPDELDFRPGDLFVLFTDGFFEWARDDGEQFGIDRTVETIRNHRHQSSREVLHAVLRAVEQFAGNRQTDDLTAIIIKRIA